MIVNRILKVLLLLLAGILIVLQGLALEAEGTVLGTIMLVLLSVLYNRITEDKSIYFQAFLVLFTIGHLFSSLGWYGPMIKEGGIDYYYYGANILYITSYLMFVLKIIKSINFREAYRDLAIPVVILLVLDVFCVIIVSDTTRGTLSFYEYILEFVYNSVIMLLLSLALINYLYRNDKKSMLFLIGSICIVFSEIIQLAYYYIIDDNYLGFVYSFFLVMAFIFFYLKSQAKYTGPQPSYLDMDERLGA